MNEAANFPPSLLRARGAADTHASQKQEIYYFTLSLQGLYYWRRRGEERMVYFWLAMLTYFETLRVNDAYAKYQGRLHTPILSPEAADVNKWPPNRPRHASPSVTKRHRC